MSSTTPENKTSKDYYFDSYSHFGIHEEMLKDGVRTNAYRDAIMQNKHLFKDKVVLDIGCGTGILCLFAAKAGAKRVIGMDMSDIIDKARQIVADNGFSGVIELIKGKVEDVKELPFGVEKVDIIISEWMGYFLLYESMLETVLYARDRWLAPGGYLFPDQCTMYVSGIEDSEYKKEKIEFWDNVYGFNFSAIKGDALREPLVDFVEGHQVITTQSKFLEIDLNTIQPGDLKYMKRTFEFQSQYQEYCQALIAWFDCVFSRGCHKPVHFSTGPFTEGTHWKQTVFYLENDLPLNPNDQIKGVIEISQNKNNHRDLDISIEYSINDGTSIKQEYIMR
ncbi:arginine methyltransferase [Naegleria gruberi]|uniref:type I protein arginine methyltransferase n=1 Tax=Naegleria gruberi TaxID=5762 RepID=D2VQD0_NAEGR|nr:arginine methyltransferase [Naegleria gruberi]EFC40925.1 arginine methyltransferase [Naegleria gruberi]|eukprot:XP_002673669.1 arginine methyltransferase [Naegleria gruberi strain NEG-M]